MKRVLLLALLAPLPLAAQSRTQLSTFVASDMGVSSSPTVLGLSASRESGRLGLRVGGSIDAGSTPLSGGTAASRLTLWSAGVDALLFLGDTKGSGLNPYLLAGVGGRGVNGGQSQGTAADYAYGAGLRVPLLGPLTFESEARYRTPFVVGTNPLPADVSAGWEVRAGLGVRIGRGASRVAPAPPAPVYRPAGVPVLTRGVSGASRAAIASRVIDLGDDYLGVPYRWGGNTPKEGFDCSGFVHFVFEREGIELPRVSRDQARVGIPVPLEISEMQPGDLIAFASHGSEVDHIAIYAGGGRILQSSSSGGGVRYDDLNSPRGRWYREHMVAVRRVIGEPLAGR
ncbi:MAG TPA: C40 family peptidase [Longimicrobiaceae bacterium]|nr:C40 family peptidase [Longimicrobiaceae bacterium]